GRVCGLRRRNLMEREICRGKVNYMWKTSLQKRDKEVGMQRGAPGTRMPPGHRICTPPSSVSAFRFCTVMMLLADLTANRSRFDCPID
ncbi:Os03g0774600, partial [Oryza sativa Japonica Group]